MGGPNPETEIINRLKSRDEEAFRQVVESNKNAIYHLCFGMLGNTFESEDLTQEVFIEVFHSIHKFKGKSKLSTWLHRIAINKCLDFLKAQKTSKRFAQGKVSTDDIQINDSSPDPFGNLEDKERANVLQWAMDSLPDTQRVAFSMFQLEGRKYEEISEIMETSVASVESLLFRARTNLKKQLQGYYKSTLVA